MTLTDALQVATAIAISLGGGGAIVMALSSWLGRVWANRILEADRRKYTDELERVRSELEASRRLLQAELDKAIHVHRVQFETEFRALADIWAKLAVLRGAMGGLRPSADIRDPDEDPNERFRRRFVPFARALNDFRRAVDDQSPFYSEAIFRELSRALTIATGEQISVSLGQPEKAAQWFQDGQENFDAFKKSAEAISTLIRQRLESLRTHP